MSTFLENSTLFRKVLMALTGLFLSVFLIVHLAGNLQLLLPPDQASIQFNQYSKFMTSNLLIKIVSYVLYLSIILHAVLSLIITLKNKKSAGGGYAYDKRAKVSNWYSRNMGILGTIILLFLIVHMKDFWYEYKFGSLPMDAEGNKDLFSIVVSAFGEPLYVVGYIIAFVALGYHLLHGIFSAFKTFGAYPSRISSLLYFISTGLTILLTVGFIFIPIFIYLKYHIA